jgi:hypothetical protein
MDSYNSCTFFPNDAPLRFNSRFAHVVFISSDFHLLPFFPSATMLTRTAVRADSTGGTSSTVTNRSPWVVWAVTVRPAISPLGFRVAIQIEHLNMAFPDGLTIEDFMNWHSFAPNRSAVVQLRNGDLNPCNVILFILHNVEPVQQPSIDSLQSPLPLPECNESRHEPCRNCKTRN